MEITLLTITAAVFSVVRCFPIPGSNLGEGIIKFAVDAITEGTIGELMEELIEGLAKMANGISDRQKKKKVVLQAVSEIMCLFNSLSDSEKAELMSALDNAAQKDKSISSNYKKYQKAMEKANNPTELVKSLSALVEDVIGAMEKEVDASFECKNVDELAKSYFKAEYLPDSATKMTKIVSDCVYKIKYINLADRDRDVVKLIQVMMSENKAELIGQMNGYLSLILQQNSQIKASVDEKEVASEKWSPRAQLKKLEKTNPFIWIELKCPRCGAGGDCVERYSDLLLCKTCGAKSSIYDNKSEEVRAIIGEMNANLFDGIKAALGEVEDRLRGELGKLGDIESSVDDLNSKISKMARQMLVSETKVVEAIAYAAEDSKSREKEINAAVSHLIRTIKKEREERGSLSDALDEMERKLDERDRRVISHLEEQTKMLRKLVDSQAYKNVDSPVAPHSPVAATPIEAAKRTCPICGRDSSSWDGDRHTTCGMTASEADGLLPLILTEDRIGLWIALQDGECSTDYPSAARLMLDRSVRDSTNKVVSPDGVRSETLRRLDTLLIDSSNEIKLSTLFLMRLAKSYCFKNCKRIILSPRITYTDERTKRSGWSYDSAEGLLKKG